MGMFESKTSKEIAAAVTAATAVPLMLNWSDFIKTRMQGASAVGSTSLPYTGGFFQIASRMLAEDGVFAVWRTGMAASLGREWTTIGIRIGAYPAVRDALSYASKGRSGGEAGVGSKFAAGAVLGVISGVATTPFDLIRIRVQADAGRLDANGILSTGLRAGSPPQVRNSFQGFRGVVGEGPLSLFRGASVNVVRSTFMTTGTMPVYEHTKHMAKSYFGVIDSPALHFGAGIVAGLVGTTVTAPSDVLRTRIMQSGNTGRVGIVQAAGAILHEYGPLGFFRGWLPAYMRVGPLFLMMPALVEQARKRLFGLDYIV